MLRLQILRLVKQRWCCNELASGPEIIIIGVEPGRGKGDDLPESGAGKEHVQCLRSQITSTRAVTPAASRRSKATLAAEVVMTQPTTEACRSRRFGVITADIGLGSLEGLQWQSRFGLMSTLPSPVLKFRAQSNELEKDLLRATFSGAPFCFVKWHFYLDQD